MRGEESERRGEERRGEERGGEEGLPLVFSRVMRSTWITHFLR